MKLFTNFNHKRRKTKILFNIKIKIQKGDKMELNYNQVLLILKDIDTKLENILECGIETKSEQEFDDIYNPIQGIYERNQSIIGLIKYYCKPVEEGYLTFQENGRYKINDIELTCGFPLEVSYNGNWYLGTVYYNGNNYYFHCDQMEELKHVDLYDNMLVRIR